MDGALFFEKGFKWLRWTQDKLTVSYCIAIGQVRGESHVMLNDEFEEDELTERRELDSGVRVEFSAKSVRVKGFEGHEIEITFPV